MFDNLKIVAANEEGFAQYFTIQDKIVLVGYDYSGDLIETAVGEIKDK